MASSQKCHQCGKIGRCRMYVDAHTGRPIYLGPDCAKELGYVTPKAVTK